MTINDLIDNGILMEGKVKVSSWDEGEEIIILQTENFFSDHEFRSDKPIVYMFADKNGYLCIEVEN